MVDVQRDYMEPAGRLQVQDPADATEPGAQRVVPAIVQAVRRMGEWCDLIVFVGDWYAYRGGVEATHDPKPGVRSLT
jgi:hypothetical protein